MKNKNSIFIGTSIDGYIADVNGNIGYLNSVPNPDQNDMGYVKFVNTIDALVMGRTTFQKVLSFGVEWPYKVPVFVLSNSLKDIPKGYADKIEIISGTVSEILDIVHKKGYNRLYIDGGRTIQNFISEDQIDEYIITVIPILLGGGFSLFGEHKYPINLKLKSSEVFLDAIVQNTWLRS